MSAHDEISRRVVLGGGAGLVGLVALSLTGCSADSAEPPAQAGAGAVTTNSESIAAERGAALPTAAPASSRTAVTSPKATASRHSHPHPHAATSDASPTAHSVRPAPHDSSSSTHPAPPSSAPPTPAPRSHSHSSSPRPSPSPTGPPPGAVTKVSAIPVKGSVSATVHAKPVVLARPSSGTVVGFSAICTHMGCTVGTGGPRLHCPCHGSIYNAFTGAVIRGPAPNPLPRLAVRIEDGYVVAD